MQYAIGFPPGRSPEAPLRAAPRSDIVGTWTFATANLPQARPLPKGRKKLWISCQNDVGLGLDGKAGVFYKKTGRFALCIDIYFPFPIQDPKSNISLQIPLHSPFSTRVPARTTRPYRHGRAQSGRRTAWPGGKGETGGL